VITSRLIKNANQSQTQKITVKERRTVVTIMSRRRKEK